MSNRSKQRAGQAGVILSILLFAMKAWAGILSGSIAVISDALNAFLDVLTYTALYISLRIQDRSADERHPFGHRRAEPIAGLLIAVTASVLGATLIRDAFVGLFVPSNVRQSALAAALLVVGIAVKGGMALWYRRSNRRSPSPAIAASYIDSRNDVLASALALSGFALGGALDDAAGILIGGWILYSGVRVGLENLGFLMGEAPDAEMLDRIRTVATAVPGVRGVHDLRAHYVGDRLQLELHVDVDRRISLQQAHDIGVAVKMRLQEIEVVQDAFIHLDPV